MSSMNLPEIPYFDRHFIDSDVRFSVIGDGEVGGKASGLAFIQQTLTSAFEQSRFLSIPVAIPKLSVIRTDVFDAFMKRNKLDEIAYSDEKDEVIIDHFLRANLPMEILGDLRTLSNQVKTPLAIRSSSLLEDAMFEPFAGIYATKMIANNQPSPDVRFNKLIEAIKFVYASAFFKAAKDYLKATRNKPEDEKMAVIIQEVVGNKHGDNFYPDVAGVGRSFNYYPMGRAKPEQGVVNLALGLGRIIVDDGISWNYSPALPKANPPFGSMKEWLYQTQNEFWAINVGKMPAYNPTKETEYLVKLPLKEAERDGTLKYTASTFNPAANRIQLGIGIDGPRVITFAPLLVLREYPVNDVIKHLMEICEEAVSAPVEIEFAMTFNPTRFGFLQVRPMVVSNEEVHIAIDEMMAANILIASDKVLGNGTNQVIQDIVYVKPDVFEAKHTPQMAQELETINKRLAAENRPCLLIGFGRWGSSDSWLGIPVNWGQVSQAKAMVEATLPNMNVELSQGSHFFHNITSFQVSYFTAKFTSDYKIKWEWLSSQAVENDLNYVRHVRLAAPLNIKVDGRTGRGVILHS